MRSGLDTRSLARKHLDRRLESLRNAEGLTRPPRGWIKAIREAIGMTTAQLAERTGVSQSRIPRIEQGEVNGSLTLKTLRAIAEGMDCTLVYALVPNKPLEDMVRERASQVADRQLARTNQTMKLENQALGMDDLKDERARLVVELLGGDARRLWDAR
jgi:predicted DNA-binding mobile mystery protein A